MIGSEKITWVRENEFSLKPELNREQMFYPLLLLSIHVNWLADHFILFYLFYFIIILFCHEANVHFSKPLTFMSAEI